MHPPLDVPSAPPRSSTDSSAMPCSRIAVLSKAVFAPGSPDASQGAGRGSPSVCSTSYLWIRQPRHDARCRRGRHSHCPNFEVPVGDASRTGLLRLLKRRPVHKKTGEPPVDELADALTISVRPRRTPWPADQRRLARIRSVPYARRASQCMPDPHIEDTRGQPMSLTMARAQEKHRVVVILDARVSSEVVNRGCWTEEELIRCSADHRTAKQGESGYSPRRYVRL